MLGLGDYNSSDEGEEIVQPDAQAEKKVRGVQASRTVDTKRETAIEAKPTSKTKSPIATPPPEVQGAPSDAPIAGPQVGPSVPDNSQEPETNGVGSTPESPYWISRQAIRNLSLPPVPNFEIPPSPSGSPPPGSNEKFAHFLKLKSQGVHFNEKLESSSALRNPSLLQKLREFAGVDDQEQYNSTLPDGIAVPRKIPQWAFADQLNKMQHEMNKKLERERSGRAREFVRGSGSATASGGSSRSQTPGGTGGGNAPKSAAERVIAGLDRDRGGSNAGLAGPKQTDSGITDSKFDAR